MDLRELKTKAAEAFAKGKFARAAEHYAEYCEEDPKDLHARLRMGDAWAKSGKKEKAIVAYKSAAEGFARDGFLPRAIAASKLILELDPQHKGMQQMLAELYARKSGPVDPKSRRPPATLQQMRSPAAAPAPSPAASTSFADRKDAIELPAYEPPRAQPAKSDPKVEVPSPMNRKDAIELGEYEVPTDDPTTSAPRPQGPSPMNRKDAIELPPDDSERGPRRALENTAIILPAVPVPPPGPAQSSSAEPLNAVRAQLFGVLTPPAAPADLLQPETPRQAQAPVPPPSPAAEPPEEITEFEEIEILDGGASASGEIEVPIEGIEIVGEGHAPIVAGVPIPAAPAAPATANPAPAAVIPLPGATAEAAPLPPAADQAAPAAPAPIPQSVTSAEVPQAPSGEAPATPVSAEPPSASVPAAATLAEPAPSHAAPLPALDAAAEASLVAQLLPDPAEACAAAPAAGPQPSTSELPPGLRPKRPEIEVTFEPAAPDVEVEVLLTPADRKPEPAALAEAPPAPGPVSSLEALLGAPVSAVTAQSAPGPSRIWLPPAFSGSAQPPGEALSAHALAPQDPPPEAPAAPKQFRSDREAGLAAFSIAELDLDLDSMLPAPQVILPSVVPSVAPIGLAAKVPAEAPAEQAPATARPAGVPSFTELELEGDSLLHAVETAARAGIAQRGQEAGAGAEDEESLDGADDPADKLSGGLPQIPLFSDLPPDAFIELFERCPLKRLSEGELIIEQGSLGDAFYVICEGAVRVFRVEAGEKKPIATLADGAFFGEMALLSGAPRTASVEGASDDTQLLEISAPVLAQLSHRYPQVAQALKKFCRQRLLANVMNTSPLFQPFSRDDRRSLVQRFRARDVNKGEALVREGERSDGMYIVLSGEVEVKKGDTRLALLKEGDLFGEMSLLSKSPATATVMASKRTSLLRLPRPDFDELILSHPQILVLVSELTDDRRRQTEAVLGGAVKLGDEGLLLV